MTIWASTQGSFHTRSRGRRRPAHPGAAHQGHPDGVRRRLRRQDPRAGRADRGAAVEGDRPPGSLIMTRREELEAGMPAPSVIIRLKTGVKKDGTPLALEAETIVEAGAYSGALLTMSARLPGQRLPVAELRRTRLRGADPQAQHRRLPRADGAADPLRDRLAHGPDRAGSSGWIRSSTSCATCSRAAT